MEEKTNKVLFLTLLHSERPKLYRVFGRSECNRVNGSKITSSAKIYENDFRPEMRRTLMSWESGDRVMVLAFCTFSICPLSIYQVSFHSLLYFQRYALDMLFIAKIEKEK